MNLSDLKSQVKTFAKILDSFRSQSEEEQRKLIWLLEEKKALENLLKDFKDNNKEYQKIKQTAEQKSNDLLSDKRSLLKLALLCVIESMRNNKDKYNYLINGGTLTAIPGTGYSSNSNQLAFYKQQGQIHPISQHNDDLGEYTNHY